MVDYGQNTAFLQRVENVDYYPDLAGVKLSAIPPILALSLVPLWFNLLLVSVALLIGLFGFAYFAAKKEDQGKPVILRASIIRLKHRLPKSLRSILFPSIAAVVPHSPRYRS